MDNSEKTGGVTIIQVPEDHPLVVSSYTAKDPMEVYNLAKAGAQFPATPERLPIEFERSSNNYITLPEKEQGIHRVEFIIWKGYWICNVLIGTDWHHASYPNSTSMIDFLAEGQTNKAYMWPKGRIYVEE